MDLQDEQLEELRGVAEAITFRNEESGFTVAEFAVGGELATVVGVLPHIAPGEQVRLLGCWGFHATFGRQFNAKLCERSMPSTQAEILKYLSSGTVKGVRGTTARKIVETFGDNTIDVLESNPRRLATIKGISPERAEQISESFRQQFSLRQAMIALERFGMTTQECLRAHKAFGSRAAELIRQNPYLLCDTDVGIGFERADAIARELPVPPAQDLRDEAGVLHVMKRHSWQNGHTCIPAHALPEPCAALLRCSVGQAKAAVARLCEQKRLISHTLSGTDYLCLPALFNAERNCAQRIDFLLRFPPAQTEFDGDFNALLCRMEDEHGLHYDEMQRLAMRTALEKGLLIITGGPGTGKTTTLKGILQLLTAAKLKVALAAPTGRAAKRMQELTGAPAKTIHRLLEVEWGEDDRMRFTRNQRNPLAAQAVIIDEISMVDVPLFSALLDALPLGCRLVLVGDADQLPPVGAGSVLQDMLRAGTLPVVRLEKIFRQAMQSLIVTNSHAIVRGELPDLTEKNRDFFFIERNYSAQAAQLIVQLAAERLPKAYGYHPLTDIQVLCPSRKGECGTGRINELLQAALNPPAPGKREHKIGRKLFRQGDKVMQVKNNYDLMWKRPNETEPGKGVYNGDIGLLEAIDPAASQFTIRFDEERLTEYPFDAAAEELEHAFAITVHKSQGSEFPAVVAPVVGVAEMLCYRNLLYTAVTRAKNLLILVGSRDELARMVANHQKARRFSALAALLEELQRKEENIA
ncbi:MAG: ATP-dependent RecD-like DNA helicase [Oscillospiraceae bacterium]|jgi:exodeoxyribonuclease V alpha subunit|nr:ATP-dependent RecD-like DNA helicase [Oscillospiraceae bacterium]